MLRFRDIKDASAASSYYGRTDGGYYLDASDLHREVGGEGAKLLGLSSQPDFEQFKRLLQGLDPRTGEQLTAKLIDGRIAGWDVTASIPKGVTVALERGDGRIHDALWEAGRETMADLEKLITTRVRKDGKQDDRVTGNMIWYGFEHPETRPAKQDGMPDPDRHIHFVIANATFDGIEGEWKAIKFRPIMDLRKWFDRRFDMRLAGKLTDLGYQIETKYKADGSGGKRYFSWDVSGIPQSVVTKFSRRTGEVEKLAEQLGIESPTAKDKLGATSRQHKREDMTLADYRDYWDKRITPEESAQIAETIERAGAGGNPAPENTLDKALTYAIEHEFYRNSVVPWHQLAITAMEKCMGSALPEEIEPEAHRQGVLFKEGEVTTQNVLAEEERIIAFARQGRGSMPPLALAPEKMDNLASLSTGQQAICRHIWESTDQMQLIRGGAGTGKTYTLKSALAPLDCPKAILAPSATASRDVLREDFSDANTVSAFLRDREWQASIRNGVIVCDEFGMLPIKDLTQLCAVAKEQNARLIGLGDPKQHKSVARHGNMFKVLQEYAGLPVAELKEIRRQSGEYKEAIAAIDDGDREKGLKIIDGLGWLHKVDQSELCRRAADECWEAMQKGESFVVIGITHAQNAAITAELRKRLRETPMKGNDGTSLTCKSGPDKGQPVMMLGKEEAVVDVLKPIVNWSDAEKGDLNRYDGTEVIQFVQNSGPFRRGDRVNVDALKACKKIRPEHFAVYVPDRLGLSENDTIRITAGGKTVEGTRLDNGMKTKFLGFNKNGDLVTEKGTIRRSFQHIASGLVDTSFKAQGQTKERVIAVMSEQALPAIRMEQFYVDLSRGKKKLAVVTDLTKDELLKAVSRHDGRKSATELMTEKPSPAPPPVGELMKKDRLRHLVRQMQSRYRVLRDRTADGNRDIAKIHDREPGIRHAR